MAISEASYELGQHSAAEGAFRQSRLLLEERAGKAYIKGNEDLADTIRELSREIGKLETEAQTKAAAARAKIQAKRSR